MKFTHTDNAKYRVGIGYVPKPWVDYGKSHKDSIMGYFEDKVRVWDADICGDVKIDFVFEDGKAYRLDYSWWCNEFGEEDEYGEKPWIMDEYFIEEISIDDADVKEKRERDWL